jgi:hypothetical protein
VVALWTLGQVNMGLNPGQVKGFLLFHAAISWICYCFTLCKELLYQSCAFSKLYYHTSLYDAILSDASVTLTSQVHASVLVLLIAGNYKSTILG